MSQRKTFFIKGSNRLASRKHPRVHDRTVNRVSRLVTPRPKTGHMKGSAANP